MNDLLDIACNRVEAGLTDRGYSCARQPTEIAACEIVATKGDDVRHVIVIPWSEGTSVDPSVQMTLVARTAQLSGQQLHFVKVVFVNGRAGVDFWDPGIE